MAADSQCFKVHPPVKQRDMIFAFSECGVCKEPKKMEDFGNVKTNILGELCLLKQKFGAKIT